jgi:hypothetical protein
VRLLDRWLGVELRHPPRRFMSARLRTAMAGLIVYDISRPRGRSPLENLSGLVFTSLLCDRVISSGRMLQHHLARAGRRRLRHAALRHTPDAWSP